jgi:hypothetical protein
VSGLRALIFLAALLAALPAFAAQSPVGDWRMDRASLEKTVDQLIEGLLARMPEADRPEARRMMTEQRAAMKEQMAASLAATIEFAADGSVVFNESESTQTERGTWTMEGDTLHVTDSDPDSPDLSGTVAADRIELTFDVDPDDPDQGPLGDMTWVLVPAR